ncbi:MAG: ring-cleaving dioxygenase [Chloroflexota bacterium]|nr:ring-cleaving dioxygenase [Chloroflexota bacterium]
MQRIQGIHHITAVASDPQKNVDFYHEVLGQRLIKTTVNFDDPGTYHLYYGDEIGTPGTIMTYFPWMHMKRGRVGNGETGAVAYTIPAASVGYWRDRLAKYNILTAQPFERFGNMVVPFNDPDGMALELIATDEPGTIRYWAQGPIPEAHVIRGFHGVTLNVDRAAGTARVLDLMGYEMVNVDGNRTRFKGASNDVGLYIDLLERRGERRGEFGAGSVHHVAFRTVDDSEQLEYRDKFTQAGLSVTPVQDRQYFHSIYFREPNGVLFEVATDAPGFLYDEPVAELGTSLKLPTWHEPLRPRIEATLPKFTIPTFEN